MGIMKLIDIAKVKWHCLMERIRSNPVEQLEYSYARQEEQLARLKRAVLEVATAKQRMKNKISVLESELEKTSGDVDAYKNRAVSENDSVILREHIKHEVSLQESITLLNNQLVYLNNEFKRLVVMDKKLSASLERFRLKKDVLKAEYYTFKTMSSVKSELTGLSGNLSIGRTVDRIKEDIDNLRARSEAVDVLIEEGVVSDALDDRTPYQKEIDEHTLNQKIEDRLKGLSCT